MSRSPDVEELESCRTFQVSDANHWDPTDEIGLRSGVECGRRSVIRVVVRMRRRMRRVLRAAMHGWSEMCAAELRGACVYVVFHFVHVFSLGLRSSQASSVRGYI